MLASLLFHLPLVIHLLFSCCKCLALAREMPSMAFHDSQGPFLIGKGLLLTPHPSSLTPHPSPLTFPCNKQGNNVGT